ncbi:MAG: metal ABC transporter substrate-binding protein [Nocardioides sp.]
MTRPSRSLVAALLVAGSLLTPLLSACGDAGPGPAGASGGRSVVAAFYPLAYVAGRVAGPFADVTNLTRPGGEPHDLELGFNQTVALHEADVVVYEAGFQPAVDDAVAGLSGEQVVDAARVVALHALPDHPDEVDPHFWQDPLLLADVADATADSLAAADPAHAADYAANAAVLRQDLVRLDREYTAGLTGCERSVVVVSHDAFEYLGRYGLTFAAIAGLSPDAEPTSPASPLFRSWPGRRGSPPCSPSDWRPRRWPTRWRAIWGSGRPSSTRSKG